ncbi:MAG: FixH family protein [Pseudomonadota bacterium]
MKKLAVITLIVLVVASIGCAKGYEVTKNAGEYSVSLKMEKSTPTVGDNLIMIAVKDATGKPVTDASITVEYSMPAMPGMPAMNYSTEAASHGTEYHATMNLSMAGAWNIAVKITRAEKTETVNFNVDAR